MKILWGLLLAAVISSASVAQTTQPSLPSTVTLPAIQPASSDQGGIHPQIGVGATPIVIAQQPAVAPPLAEPTAAFSVGTWIADAFGVMITVFGTVIATFLTQWVKAVAAKAGVQMSQAMSDKLDAVIERGLHAGADQVAAKLDGTMSINVKNKIIAHAVQYAQDHAEETIKNLNNGSVDNAKIVEGLQARATKALNDIAAPPTVTASAVSVTNSADTKPSA